MQIVVSLNDFHGFITPYLYLFGVVYKVAFLYADDKYCFVAIYKCRIFFKFCCKIYCKVVKFC